jgi:proline iminopeptidase
MTQQFNEISLLFSYDMVCPMITAWELHKTWPKAELIIVPDAGHSAKEPGIIDSLIYATEKFKTL